MFMKMLCRCFGLIVFIVHKDSNFLDGQYTVFGRILTDESFETLDKIVKTLHAGLNACRIGATFSRVSYCIEML